MYIIIEGTNKYDGMLEAERIPKHDRNAFERTITYFRHWCKDVKIRIV